MNKILVYVALQDGSPRRSSLEVLSEGRRLAGTLGWTLEAAVLQECGDDALDRIGQYGPSAIHRLSRPLPAEALNPVVIAALTRVLHHVEPSVTLFASSEEVKDFLGGLASRIGASAISDVSELSISDGGVEVLRPVMAAKMMARVQIESYPALVSVRSGSFEAEAVESSYVLNTIDFVFDSTGVAQKLVDVLGASGGEVDLSEARVVIAAGRGVRDEEGKRLIVDLARVLNGAIGASRAVVESGLFPATAQIGQTGKVVSPELYFAVGISGAIQHVAGMSNSRVIVAINKDPDAPIFSYATYGLVGDLYKILPELITKLETVVATT